MQIFANLGKKLYLCGLFWMKRKVFIVLLCICHVLLCSVWAQEPSQRTSISGVVVDADTGEALPFVQIYFLKSTTNKGMIPSEIGTTTDIDGNFTISNTAGYNTLNFQMLGFKTEMLTLRKGQNRKDAKIKLTPDVYGLKDIVVTPKNRKREYRRKGNPAVELIKEVIAHKDSFCVTTEDHYTAKSYSRMSLALDNLKINWVDGQVRR